MDPDLTVVLLPCTRMEPVGCRTPDAYAEGTSPINNPMLRLSYSRRVCRGNQSGCRTPNMYAEGTSLRLITYGYPDRTVVLLPFNGWNQSRLSYSRRVFRGNQPSINNHSDEAVVLLPCTRLGTSLGCRTPDVYSDGTNHTTSP